jgi:hypothetical protein
LIEHLAEYKALEEEDGRRAAFAKFVKRQKVGDCDVFINRFLIIQRIGKDA